MFRFLVPPSILIILVIIGSILILIPTLSIIIFTLSSSVRAAGYPSGSTIAQKVHSPFGRVEMKP